MKTSFPFITLMALTPPVLAGSLDAPSAPTGAGSAMYSLQSICDRLQTGAAGSQNAFTEPTAGPGSTTCTLNQLMTAAPALDNTNGATPAEVIVGKTFWGLRNGTWGLQTGSYNSASACSGTATLGDVLAGQTFSGTAGLGQTGTMPNIGAVTLTPTTTDQTIAAGYHNGSGKVLGDADLVAGNIKTGTNIFGVVGTLLGIGGNVQDTSSGDAVAGDLLTGKKAWVDGAEITGTVAVGANVTGTAGNLVMAIPNGLYSGGKTATANDADLMATNIKSGINLFGTVGTLIGIGGNVQDTTTGDAVAGDILAGKKAWVDGAEITGTVAVGANVTGTAGNLVMAIPNGLYSGGKTATANDADLIATNVRSGINIFGVTGDLNVVNTSTGDATAANIATGKKAWVDGAEITGTAISAAVPRTGQTTCYDASGTSITCAGTGQDGALQKGVAFPSPRFTNNSNGTVTDNLTGLIWLKDANCFGTKDWTTALSSANALANGTCGLTDGSTAGQWRLPNLRELYSLIDLSTFNPASTGYPFTGVQNDYYWSASSYATNTTYAWVVGFNVGRVVANAKTVTYYVWPVRGGQ